MMENGETSSDIRFCEWLKREDELKSINKMLDNKHSHYDNSKGSLYKFAEEQNLNSWEFDLIKRIVRCRKKGQFKADLEKSKFLIDLYLEECSNLK